MLRLLHHRAVPWVLGLLLGGVFVYASYDKILHPGEFARIVYHYQLIGPSKALPPLLPNLLAVTLPWMELLMGLALIVGVWRREAAVLCAAMLVVFIAAVGSALYRGINLENCGCFTVSGGENAGRQAGIKLIIGDTALLAAAGLLIASRPGPRDGEERRQAA